METFCKVLYPHTHTHTHSYTYIYRAVGSFSWWEGLSKNDSKSHISNSFFENIISGVQLYSTRSSGQHQSFYFSGFCCRKSQSQ